jgi:hypothetical protein
MITSCMSEDQQRVLSANALSHDHDESRRSFHAGEHRSYPLPRFVQNTRKLGKQEEGIIESCCESLLISSYGIYYVPTPIKLEARSTRHHRRRL